MIGSASRAVMLSRLCDYSVQILSRNEMADRFRAKDRAQKNSQKIWTENSQNRTFLPKFCDMRRICTEFPR
jgi:hypothetical protein